MSDFVSTRGSPAVPLTRAVFAGLAEDGGLFMPRRTPVLPPEVWGANESSIDDRERFCSVARSAAGAFFPSLEPSILAGVIERSFGFAMPLVEVDPGLYLLELFHGPTHAFKDVGARFMAQLMTAIGDEGDRHTILVATSGDTGGAVAAAFHGSRRHRVRALFPRDGISERQRKQMTTLGDNVEAIGVDGTFDDCQRLVKEAFSAPSLANRHGLTSANSINVARLLPQCLYYVHGYVELLARDEIAADTAPVFVVPSGNLGNLTAGLMAKHAGMPASYFLSATNENRAFVDFLDRGFYRPRPTVQTTSNAMDVGAPSNLERIRWLYDGREGELRRDIRGESVDQAAVKLRIRDVHHRTGYVLDPHSAVAYEAAMRHDLGSMSPTIVVATAHPAKFPDVVAAAIGHEVPLPPGLDGPQDAEERMTEIAPTLESLTAALDASL